MSGDNTKAIFIVVYGNRDYDDALLKFPLNNDLRQRMLFAGKPNMERYAEALANRDMDWFLSQGLGVWIYGL